MKLRKVILASLLFIVVGSSSLASQSTDFLVRAGDVVRGDPHAPVTLLEYSDFTCGYCEKFFHETWPRLSTQYVENGKIRFVYRDFPRSPTGPALHAAKAARCAADQQAYWPMHDRLFSSGGQYSLEQLRDYAKELGLNAPQFAQCLDSERHVAAIYQDRLEGGSLGIRGTPGFVLFLTDLPEDGEIVLIPGAFPFEVFQEQIDKLLGSTQTNQPSPSGKQNQFPQPEGT